MSLSLLLLLLLSSFSASSSAADFSSELKGHWLQDCAGRYQKEELFEGDRATYTEHNFRGTGCSGKVLEMISRGTLVPGSAIDGLEGVNELDFVFESVTFIPIDEATADFYEKSALCGLTGWRVGEPKVITGLVCEFFGQGLKIQVPAAGVRKYGIAKVTANELYLGLLSPERDASSPERRPRELDPLPYRRQP